MQFNYVIILKLLLLFGSATAQIKGITSDYLKEIGESNGPCDAYCFKMLKPMLPTIEETKIQLNFYEDFIRSKNEQILALKRKLANFQTNAILYNERIKQKDELIMLLQQRTCSDNNSNKKSGKRAGLLEAKKNETIEVSKESNFNSSNQMEADSIGNETRDVFTFQASNFSYANQTEGLQIEELPLNCLGYENSSDFNEIMVPNVGRLQVLCNESGWTVILNRFDGSENFYRNWFDYRKGFGNLQREFFIGLEVLHQMTTYQRYELHIELTDFQNNVRKANYNNFIIGSEEDAYKLKDLGSYEGDLGDALPYNIGQKFTTIDSDNDKWPEGNCAIYYSSGGWYDRCANSNLFGKFFHSEVENKQGIWWYRWKGYKTLRAVKMMIRSRD
ncbi:fibroleukin-like isoform X1 [Drosophila albomicans]|uniref:Fibroleukin-like isoform X1 n=1 Tax=Drosophila albomicans TaxID=7291 RepID=A0A9C6T256_DROAB|nr:fibroleukin-like isoform X1 [Drosophila albomicans]